MIGEESSLDVCGIIDAVGPGFDLAWSLVAMKLRRPVADARELLTARSRIFAAEAVSLGLASRVSHASSTAVLAAFERRFPIGLPSMERVN